MRFHDPLGDREPQSGAALSANRGVFQPEEPVENPFPLILRNSDAVIGNSYSDFAVHLQGLEGDLFTFIGISGGIGY